MGTEPRFYRVEKEGPVIIWKFHNPPRNLATLETGAELVQLVEEFDRDPEVRVGIITSATPGMFIPMRLNALVWSPRPATRMNSCPP